METPKLLKGPFRSREKKEDIRPERREIARPPINHELYQREMLAYFEQRQKRLQVVKTTTTPRGQVLDWVPLESQHPSGEVAAPPPTSHLRGHDGNHPEQKETLALSELEREKGELGPKGTVPILRKNLEALGYTKSLKRYLSKSRGHRVLRLRGAGLAVPEEGGSHRYANSGESVTCFGGEGQLSCFDPYLESSDDFSLIQIGLSNSDLGFLQTVEAGWQEFQDLTGDWVPHLFVYYTTNGYSDDGDNKGGYNRDVDGWVQYDNQIYPGTTFTPYSTRGGGQFKMTIKYQLYQGNWWFACQGRWVGYYPASLFMGNQSVFSTLGDHADYIGFWGEIYDSDDVAGRTTSDMGSGYFAEAGWTWSGYMHNLLYQSDRGGSMSEYDGTGNQFSSDPDMYDIQSHYKSGSSWGSYVYLGGPGAG